MTAMIYDPFVAESLRMGYHVPGASPGDRAAAIQYFIDRGYAVSEVATILHITERTVMRLKQAEIEPMPEELPEWALDDEKEWPKCSKGHELTPDNLLARAHEKPRCRICRNEYLVERYHNNKERASA